MEKLRDFRYQGVELKNSLWERQRRETIETYLAIPNDSLLHIFRKTAGLDAPGESLMGWYGNGASTFGQKLGAFAKLYAVTGDYRLKEKAVSWRRNGADALRQARKPSTAMAPTSTKSCWAAFSTCMGFCIMSRRLPIFPR